ncbi:cupin domain-containing protein [Enterococcus asini]|uniref:Ethanolamine utilization protein EutQ n=1 Tax=Enterococcus asini ATCC 700915 TaxID=1158606 RepID=R2PPQ9_9ENTE|nr:cupin domain-containing protein [Enterococcus asini]EOH85293.1 hypothetical protein UAS_02195 [Enterococcus asini ATCC 700915]EOT57341.1 hypothetical protein I579_00891 [Enterococcus asini ATCC 700915]MCD5028821.1 DUF861 domain-containing protein [Enterococcus asini]MDT2743322.1 cupin domain-containing protein [Enterococcus asini]MDT2764073.1 cupin domain-containing protein [Enterococcus asini]
MKKLICAEDIIQAHEMGRKQIGIDSNTIVTPSAKDLAATYQIELQPQDYSEVAACLPDQLSKEGFVAMLRALLADSQEPSLPYVCKKHSNGLKSIQGKSVKMAVFETGNPNANVHCQELIGQEESQISAGFLEIDHSSFDWELTYEEIDYVIEGTLQVTIDGITYTAEAGDVLFVPKNSRVTWGSPNKAKIFYATYPANWADLL